MIRGAFAVAGKELRTFFLTPIGYVILLVFTFLAGWWVFYSGRFFVVREADLRVLFQFFPWAFLLFAPAVTMRLWAEEKKQNTFEVMMTTPLGSGALVLGKFLAAVGALAVWFVCLAPMVGVVAWVGDPDPGPILGGLLSALLLGAAYIAIGLTVSACTENQIIALVGSFAASLAFFLLSQPVVAALFPGFLGSFLQHLSLSTHFASVQRGVIDARDLVYYLSFIGFFLYWNAWLVSRRRGSPWNVALAAAVAVLVNVFFRVDAVRLDLTEDQRFTLSEVTEEVLQEQLEGPLRITAYLSSDLPASQAGLRRDVVDLLDELRARNPDRVEVRLRDPGVDEGAREDAVNARIPEPEFRGGSATSLEIKRAHFGLHLEYFDQEEFVPPRGSRQILSAESLEYDLLVRIDRITRSEPLVVAFHVNERRRGRDMAGRQLPPGLSDRHAPDHDLRILWREVGQRFDTTVVDLKAPVPGDVRTLILTNGTSLDEHQKFHLDQYVMRGGNLVLLMEGNEPGSPGGMNARRQEVRKSVASTSDDLWSNWGISIHKNVVLDVRCGLRGSAFYPAFVHVETDTITPHELSRGVRQLFFPFASSIALEPKPGVEATKLVFGSEEGSEVVGGDILMLDAAYLPDPRNPEERSELRYQYLLAGLLQGRFHSLYALKEVPASLGEVPVVPRSPEETRILVVGSSDFVTDGAVDYATKVLGVSNLELVDNAVGRFTSGRDLSPLRSKRLVGRPFSEPDSVTELSALFLGVYFAPLLLLVAAFGVHWWRRVLRPEQARARLKAALGARPAAVEGEQA